MVPARILTLALLLQLAVFPSVRELRAADVGVDINIRLGGEPRPVIVAEPPYQPEPEPYYEEVEEEVEFVYPEELGFYVAVGVPYDLFYLNNFYFIFRGGRWLRSPSSRGGWVAVRHRELPPSLRRHRIERIREYRTREYVVYRRDREHYRGRHRLDKGNWKAARHEEKRYEKERRREEKRYQEDRHHAEKRHEEHKRREEKRSEREHRGRD